MLAITFSSCVKQPLISEKPNVIIIFADDLGYSYGSIAYQTPNIDRLAAEGARFTDFYVSQPIRTASRASLMTGTYANRIGLNGIGSECGNCIHLTKQHWGAVPAQRLPHSLVWQREFG